MAWYYGWKPYVPVAQRRAQAAKKMEALKKKGVDVRPVQIEGRKIARTFWGKGWCDHLESFGDFANRLPRGRTYVRNGSVCHLEVHKGKVQAKVSGSSLYDVDVKIKTLPKAKWEAVKKQCAGEIGSLLELLEGRLSDNIMSVVTDRREGLFPLPGEISFDCSCPDYATMCKHVAAVMYGVGARLDERPDLLFLLRGVDHEELIDTDADAATDALESGTAARLDSGDLGDIFGIEIAAGESAAEQPAPASAPPAKKASGSRKSRKKPKASRGSKASTKSNSTKSTRKSTAKRKAAKKKSDAKKTTTATAAKQTTSRKAAKKKVGTKRKKAR